MIPQVDEALKAAVRAALGSADVEVVLDAPTKEWAARRNAPTISLYLYDLREDPRRRSLGTLEQRGPDGVVRHRFSPPRMFRLSYLVTAWTQRPEDEHRLLDAVLGNLVELAVLPGYAPTGLLADAGITAPLLVGVPPPEDRGIADVWSALGGELKPSIDLVIIAPADVSASGHVGPPVQEGLVLDVEGRGGGAGASEYGVQRHVPPPATDGRGAVAKEGAKDAVGEGAGGEPDGGTHAPPSGTPRARARRRTTR